MKIRRSSLKLCNVSFAIATLCLTANLLTYQALNLADFKSILRYVGVGFFLLTILISFKRIKWNISLLIVLLYSAIMFIIGDTYLTDNAVNMVAIIIVLFASQCVEYEDMMAIFNKVAILLILLWSLLLVLGLIEIKPWKAYRISGTGSSTEIIIKYRYSLGFLYEINLGAWFITSALTIILLQHDARKSFLILVSILNIYIYIVTDSRTTFGFFLIFIIVYFLFIITKSKTGIIIKKSLAFTYAFFFLFPFISGVLIQEFPWLDAFTSGRLFGLVDRMKGMTLVNYIFGWYYRPLACFYYLLLTQFGVLVYFLFYYLILKGSKSYLNTGKNTGFCFIFAMTIVGLFEGSLFAIEELSSIVFWSFIGKGIIVTKNR